jgi:tripartite-type tricarboxylate transporter receptor subunit TctC
VIGVPSNGTAYEPLFKNSQARFDPLRFNWIGSLNRVVNIVVVWHATPYRSVNDLFDKQIILSGESGADGTIIPYLLNDLIGTKFKVVTGYAGGAQTMLAVMRGEVEGTVNMAWDSLKATKYDLIEEKKIRILLQIALKKLPELGDVPFVMDHVKTEENRKALELLLAKLEYGRPFVAPADVPPELIALYREAFTKMTADEAFLADAAKMRAEISATTGSEMQEFIGRVYHTPEPTVERARQALANAGGIPK